jgi:hypothetical protein
VEILLNCLWLVLSLSLMTAWVIRVRRVPARRGRSSRTALLPSTRLQLTAMMVLILLLFPVISLTDDLAMCAATRDTEQTLRLDDLCSGAHPQPAMLPSTLAWMETVTAPVTSGTRCRVERETQLLTLQEGTHLPIDSRPPPSAV